MRAGGEYFLEPAEAVQRRYEALRCYFVEDATAESVGARFGYSPATVHQLAAELRAGRSSFFRSSKPGPKGPRKTHTIRDRVLVLRAANYPGTKVLSSFHSMASLLMLKCSRRGRAGNAFPLGADPGLGLALGLLALPKATHLTSYSYRVRRASNLALLEGLGRQC